jgi:hypothetical protein
MVALKVTTRVRILLGLLIRKTPIGKRWRNCVETYQIPLLVDNHPATSHDRSSRFVGVRL